MIVQRPNPFTRTMGQMDLDVTEEQLARWRGGELIQSVMPQLSPDEREFLISGIAPGEWDQIFPPEEW